MDGVVKPGKLLRRRVRASTGGVVVYHYVRPGVDVQNLIAALCMHEKRVWVWVLLLTYRSID